MMRVTFRASVCVLMMVLTVPKRVAPQDSAYTSTESILSSPMDHENINTSIENVFSPPFDHENVSNTSTEGIPSTGSDHNVTHNSCGLNTTAIYIHGNRLQLNVSWIKPEPKDLNPGLGIFSYRNKEGCENSKSADFEIDKNVTHHISPNEEDDRLKIYLGCSYMISLGSCEMNYTIPKCVNGICSCRMDPIKINMEVDRMWAPLYRINWTLNEPHRLRNVTFKLHFFDNNITHLDANISKSSYGRRKGTATTVIKGFGPTGTLEGNFQMNNSCWKTFDLKLDLRETEEPEMSQIVLWTFVLLGVFVVVGIVSFALRKRTTVQRVERNMAINILYVPHEACLPDEIPAAQIVEIEPLKLNSGFGDVYRAMVRDLNDQPGWLIVALKKSRGQSYDEKQDFLAEIQTMKRVGKHPHIVRLLGFCTLAQPYSIVMEYMNGGSLLDYLENLRDEWDKLKDTDSVFTRDGTYIEGPPRRVSDANEEDPLRESVTTQVTNLTDETGSLLGQGDYKLKRVLDHRELRDFALQIARGMAHLEKIPVTHRDLAARNVLVNEERGHKTLKISDFGMSKVGPYVNQRNLKVPWRWMALEAIEELYTDSKSDMWSFGVVLWEIGTLGARPYNHISDNMLPFRLREGYRLERPEVCTDELYSLMLRCWAHLPQERPSFVEVVALLDSSKRAYIDFKDLDPNYRFPPTEVRRP